MSLIVFSLFLTSLLPTWYFTLCEYVGYVDYVGIYIY